MMTTFVSQFLFFFSFHFVSKYISNSLKPMLEGDISQGENLKLGKHRECLTTSLNKTEKKIGTNLHQFLGATAIALFAQILYPITLHFNILGISMKQGKTGEKQMHQFFMRASPTKKLFYTVFLFKYEQCFTRETEVFCLRISILFFFFFFLDK